MGLERRCLGHDRLRRGNIFGFENQSAKRKTNRGDEQNGGENQNPAVAAARRRFRRRQWRRNRRRILWLRFFRAPERVVEQAHTWMSPSSSRIARPTILKLTRWLRSTNPASNALSQTALTNRG